MGIHIVEPWVQPSTLYDALSRVNKLCDMTMKINHGKVQGELLNNDNAVFTKSLFIE